MTERERAAARPLEETPEAAAAVEDESTVPQLITDGGPGAQPPRFGEPGAVGGTRVTARTGAEQPWDPEDLARAQGKDPTPRNVERARRELEESGPAAIEKTVP
ncbi:MAG TPA: hypothetical protein VIL44_12115 [Micromonospora sp.]